MRINVTINRRPEIADPEGATVQRALQDLGYTETKAVRMNRVIQLDVEDEEPSRVRARVEQMCRQVLANPVLEDFEIEVLD